MSMNDALDSTELLRLLATYKLKRQNSPTPHYLLVAQPVAGQPLRILADVYHTGSLPSCYRWHAVIRNLAKDDFEARTGRPWSTLATAHTRAKVVDAFLNAYARAGEL